MTTSIDTPVRGDETRAQLIQAGLKLFGRLGYEPGSDEPGSFYAQIRGGDSLDGVVFV